MGLTGGVVGIWDSWIYSVSSASASITVFRRLGAERTGGVLGMEKRAFAVWRGGKSSRFMMSDNSGVGADALGAVA